MACSYEYKKFDENEIILPGDIVSLMPIENKVTKAICSTKCHDKDIVIGVCEKIANNMVLVKNKGIIDVNVSGVICIGDHVGASELPGTAKAIKYVYEDEDIFNLRCIGKVIGLYKVYNKAKVLLDIE